MSSLNRQSLGEEIANAVSHGIGALLAVLGTVVLIVYASYNSSVSGIVSAAIYGFCLSLSDVYNISCYNKQYREKDFSGA